MIFSRRLTERWAIHDFFEKKSFFFSKNPLFSREGLVIFFFSRENTFHYAHGRQTTSRA
jgi:hypothetical protein